ncbi:hypothetical protein ACWE42_15040 [Sutcliffiella cohnii]
MKNKFLSIFVLSLSFVVLFSTNVSANEIEKQDVSELFINFIDQAFEETSTVTALDSNGFDKTEEFINIASKYLNNLDYKSIQELIKEDGLEVSFAEMEELYDDDMIFTTMSNIRSRSVSQQFYNLATSNRNHSAEWVVTVYGTFSYDANTYRVTHTNNPSISLTVASFGALFSPYMTSVSTSSSYSGSTATFRASYTMMAEQGVRPVAVTHNYGSKNPFV